MSEAPHEPDSRRGDELIPDARIAGTVLEVVDALVVVLDPSAIVVAFNRACEKASGYTSAEVIGRCIWDRLIPPEDVDTVRRVFAALRGGAVHNAHTNEWIAKDGSRRRIRWSNTILPEPDGSIRFVIGTGHDLTDSEDAVLSLQAREEQLRAVVTTAVDGIVTIDKRGIIESFNPAAERLFGYTANEAIGEPVHILMPSPESESHQHYVENYLQTGESKIIGIGREVMARRKDGSTFMIDLAVSEIGHLGLFVGIVRDLTERKQSEEKLRLADRLASIGSLAAGLGHDMNNVLLPMRGRLDALEAADLPPDLRVHLRAVRDSVSYLQQLTDGLHLLALDPRDKDASAQSTDVAVWWDQVGPLLQRSLPRTVRLASSIPSRLPRVAVEPHRLTQVALNLLVNAGHAVGDDGRVRLEAERCADGERVRMAISDNGTGMPPEIKARAFEAFFTTKDRGRGTGLGLALVHGIVTSAGGSLEIESEPGAGTTVEMHLPVADQSLRHRAGDGDAPLAAVISLEDDRIATLIASFLEDEGIRVSRESTADPSRSMLWITSPAHSDVGAVQRFLNSPSHRVIACGPEAHAWSRLGALVIGDVFDFELLRDRVGEAIEGLSAD